MSSTVFDCLKIKADQTRPVFNAANETKREKLNTIAIFSSNKAEELNKRIHKSHLQTEQSEENKHTDKGMRSPCQQQTASVRNQSGWNNSHKTLFDTC